MLTTSGTASFTITTDFLVHQYYSHLQHNLNLSTGKLLGLNKWIIYCPDALSSVSVEAVILECKYTWLVSVVHCSTTETENGLLVLSLSTQISPLTYSSRRSPSGRIFGPDNIWPAFAIAIFSYQTNTVSTRHTVTVYDNPHWELRWVGFIVLLNTL